jgi:hypothetical protein
VYLDNDARLVLASSAPDAEADDGERQEKSREPEGDDAAPRELGLLVKLVVRAFLVDGGDLAPPLGAEPLAAAGPAAGRRRPERPGEARGRGDPGVAARGGVRGGVEGAVVVHGRGVRRRRLVAVVVGVARRALHVVRRPLRGLGRPRRRRRRHARHVRLRRRVLHPADVLIPSQPRNDPLLAESLKLN